MFADKDYELKELERDSEFTVSGRSLFFNFVLGGVLYLLIIIFLSDIMDSASQRQFEIVITPWTPLTNPLVYILLTLTYFIFYRVGTEKVNVNPTFLSIEKNGKKVYLNLRQVLELQISYQDALEIKFKTLLLNNELKLLNLNLSASQELVDKIAYYLDNNLFEFTYSDEMCFLKVIRRSKLEYDRVGLNHWIDIVGENSFTKFQSAKKRIKLYLGLSFLVFFLVVFRNRLSMPFTAQIVSVIILSLLLSTCAYLLGRILRNQRFIRYTDTLLFLSWQNRVINFKELTFIELIKNGKILLIKGEYSNHTPIQDYQYRFFRSRLKLETQRPKASKFSGWVKVHQNIEVENLLNLFRGEGYILDRTDRGVTISKIPRGFMLAGSIQNSA